MPTPLSSSFSLHLSEIQFYKLLVISVDGCILFIQKKITFNDPWSQFFARCCCCHIQKLFVCVPLDCREYEEPAVVSVLLQCSPWPFGWVVIMSWKVTFVLLESCHWAVYGTFSDTERPPGSSLLSRVHAKAERQDGNSSPHPKCFLPPFHKQDHCLKYMEFGVLKGAPLPAPGMAFKAQQNSCAPQQVCLDLLLPAALTVADPDVTESCPVSECLKVRCEKFLFLLLLEEFDFSWKFPLAPVWN